MKRILKIGLPILGILLFLSLILFAFGYVGIVVPLCIIGLGYIHHTNNK